MVVVTVVFAAQCAVASEVLFDSGNHVQTGSLASRDYPGDPGVHAADDFRLTIDAAITEVRWKGFYTFAVPTGTDAFEIRIYADDGTGLPASPVTAAAVYSAAVTEVDRHLTSDDMPFGLYPVYGYSAQIPFFNAAAGVRYWLEIFNDEQETNSWLWSTDFAAVGPYDAAFALRDSTTWSRIETERTFQLIGVVPEPPSLALAVTALLLLVAAKRPHPLIPTPHFPSAAYNCLDCQSASLRGRTGFDRIG
jgi:hypothetical protein